MQTNGRSKLNFVRTTKGKLLVAIGLPLIAMVLLSMYFFNSFYWLEVREGVGGLMNFVDAKQQGVIRFLGQNEKLAEELAVLVESADAESVRPYLGAIVATDVFDVEDHPFADEIRSGQRQIATFEVYHAIDLVRNGTIEVSSDPAREGTSWTGETDLRHGYSDVYLMDGEPTLTFGAVAGDGMLYVHADARMLTNIVNGEIGNLEGDMGAFYLAGVGDTFDYYIVNRDNVMITESRVFSNAVLRQKGSEFPWERTVSGDPGVYETNAGLVTGAREAMGFYDGPTGKTILGASMPFYDSEWTIVAEQEASELLGPMFAIRNLGWVIVALVTLAAAVVGFLIARSFSKGLNQMRKVAEAIAGGDLDQNIDVSGRDEIGDMARAFSAMIDNLRGLVGQVRSSADGVADASSQLSAASEQAGQATQGIADVSQQVAKGAEEQSTSVQETTASMEQLARTVDGMAQGVQEQAKIMQEASSIVQQVSSASEQVANSATAAAEESKGAAEAAQRSLEAVKSAAEAADGGSQTVDKTIDGMQKIMSAMSMASGKVTDLGDRSNEIGKIVATIDDIAAQTNLLALNAAIEAARAGEQGRGFAVVADEVRKLAERSSMATKEIADLITGIQTGVEEAVKAMEEGNTEVESGNQLAGEAGEALQTIRQSSAEVSAQIEQIAAVSTNVSTQLEQMLAASEELTAASTEMVKVIDGVSAVVEESTAATEQMAANSSEVTKSLESVAGVSEQNSAATQEISASAEEMSAQVQQVVASSHSLSEMAGDLKSAVSTFKMNGNGAKEVASQK